MDEDERIAWFLVKSTCFLILFIPSIVLIACSVSLLEPLHYGIVVNMNTRQILGEDTGIIPGADMDPLSGNVKPKVYQGGRHFLGLGREFVRLPAHRFLLTLSTWSQLGSGRNGDCDPDPLTFPEGSYDEPMDSDAEKGTPCVEGVAPGGDETEDDEKYGMEPDPGSGGDIGGAVTGAYLGGGSSEFGVDLRNFVVKHAPLNCRTRDGLKVRIQLSVTASLGVVPEASEEYSRMVDGGGGAPGGGEAGAPNQPGPLLSASVLRLYKMAPRVAEWQRLAQNVASAAVRDEVSRHDANQYYTAIYDRDSNGAIKAESYMPDPACVKTASTNVTSDGTDASTGATSYPCPDIPVAVDTYRRRVAKDIKRRVTPL